MCPQQEKAKTQRSRGLLTYREREILAQEDEVSDGYYRTVQSRVRRKITELEIDAAVLADNHPDLFQELRVTIGNTGSADEQ